MNATSRSEEATTSSQYVVAIGRAFAGALLFCLPLLMTMEMWRVGFYLEPWRLAQLMIINMIVLFGLSKVAGFKVSHGWLDDTLDALAAFLVAVTTAAAVLWLIGVIRPQMAIEEIAGMIAIQAIPASFGAMIGAKLLGEGDEIERSERWRDTYGGQLFLFLAGALFLGFTVAPTEEMILIAFQMSPLQSLLTVALSVLLLHAILYILQFHGQKRRFGAGHGRSLVFQTLPGYAVAIVATVYILWSFGRLDGLGVGTAAATVAVLGLPAAIGAGIARIAV